VEVRGQGRLAPWTFRAAAPQLAELGDQLGGVLGAHLVQVELHAAHRGRRRGWGFFGVLRRTVFVAVAMAVPFVSGLF